ncbi:hypothetical protein ACHAW5_010353 [Stephanodiscus triporus]|uniref:NAD(P)-binding domain-containing protein n=1 Tax=Stephanodiscus triporus TaxID=2934178 RepID=A0ABD3N8J8_9STRA
MPRRVTASSISPSGLPRFHLRWENASSSSSSSSSGGSPRWKKWPMRPNDSILVFGGTGGVGQLVTRKLLARGKEYVVRVAARDVDRARELLTTPIAFPLGGSSSSSSPTSSSTAPDVIRLDLVGDAKSTDDELRSAMEGVSAIVVSLGTTAFPTRRWYGGNTPVGIDSEAVGRIANIAMGVKTLRRIVLLTSVGVERTDQMPFVFLNLFGVLDAKRSGEDAVRSASRNSGSSYAIIRPGRLVGGPYTNLDLAKLFQIEGGTSNGVTMERGDALLGDCKRDAAAEAVVRCLEDDGCMDVEFSIVSNEERALTDEEWSEAFVGMRCISG